MNCHDARDWFSALLGGEIGLTEWALVDTHVRQCAECRRELEQLQPVVRPRRHIAQPRALQGFVSKVAEATRLGITRFAHLLTRPRLSLPIPFKLSARAAARVIEATRVGATRVVGLLTRARWLLPIPFKLSGRAAANVIGATRFGITCSTHRLTRLRWSPAILFKLSMRAAVKTIEATRLGATRIVGRIVLTTSSRALFREAARPGLSVWISTIRPRGGSSTTACQRIPGAPRTPPLQQSAASAWFSRQSKEPSTRNDVTPRSSRPLRIGTGVVSLAVLVVILFQGPPDTPMTRLSEGERLLQDVRPPTAPKPAEPVAAARPAATSTLKKVSPPQSAPPSASQPETRRAATRPEPPTAQAEIPAPSRPPATAPAGTPVTPPAPARSTEATWFRESARPEESTRSQEGARSQNADAPDPSAVIDWLLKEGRR
jgi:hypothetical protein